MRLCEIIIIIVWKQCVWVLLNPPMRFNYEKVTTFWDSFFNLLWTINRFTFSKWTFKPECFCSHLFAQVVLALHLILKWQCKEFVNHFLESFSVLHFPEPCVQPISKPVPGAFLFICDLPWFKETFNLIFNHVWYLTNNTFIGNQLFHDLL